MNLSIGICRQIGTRLKKVSVIGAAFIIILASAHPIQAVECDGSPCVQEGDIYQILSDDLILNLNSSRGLQVIDLSDVANPGVIGNLQLTGTPVEMYVNGNYAFVLLNNWPEFVSSGRRHGPGMVLAIDISDDTNPFVVDESYIPGSIQTSRLTREGDQTAIYAVTGGWGYWDSVEEKWIWETRTLVRSFDISNGLLVKRTEVVLSGYVTDIYANSNVFLVARNNRDRSDPQSQVTLVDISDSTGVIIKGGEVTVPGWILNQMSMGIHNGIIRVASSSRWGSSPTNHLETFDASDIYNISPIDQCEFGDNERLFGTLFVDDKVFTHTAAQMGHFHGFAISANGECEELSEFEVSGWNSFFRPVFNNSRLIGIGVNDEDGRTMAVSLYDVSSWPNTNPLMARAGVEGDYSWSEASWDHRAFSVLENAVSVETEEGVEETGLILLPFSGGSDDVDEYTSAVQIFTFSDETLTRRGLMEHGNPARRSFLTGTDIAANLSESSLNLFDHSDPDYPQELGRVDLEGGMITVCLSYDETGLSEQDEMDLRLFQDVNGTWIDVTNLPNDIDANIVCGDVSWLSPFAILIQNNPPVADAGENLTIASKEASTTIIQGTASDEDAGDALNFRWLHEGTVLLDWAAVGSSGECPLDLSTVSLGIGTYTLALEVTDDKDTASDEMILTVDNSAPTAGCTGGGVYQIFSPVTLGGSVADFDGDVLTYKWVEGGTDLYSGEIQTVAGGDPVTLPEYTVYDLPLGVHILTLIVNDGINELITCDVTVTMQDATDPTLAPVPNKTILWPPNHKMVDIVIEANASDNSGGVVTLSALVSSNEPQDGLGDGDTAPDWTEPTIDQESGVITLRLRAERSGSGEGRVYTIMIIATDDSGNSSESFVEIIVPHDKGKKK